MMKVCDLYQILRSNDAEETNFFHSKGFSLETVKRFNLFQLKNWINIDEMRMVLLGNVTLCGKAKRILGSAAPDTVFCGNTRSNLKHASVQKRHTQFQ